MPYRILFLTMALSTSLYGQVRTQTIGAETTGKLLTVRRIYVESFGEDKIAKVLQSMIINALTESKQFIVTENREKADSVLKGTAIQRTSQELHSTSEGTSVATVGGAASATRTAGSAVIGGLGLGTADSSTSTETIDYAAVSVRLVASDGDTIWSTTQESRGAKFKGAGADVADKIVKQLVRDIEKASKERKP